MVYINDIIIVFFLYILIKLCHSSDLFCYKTIKGVDSSSYFGYSVQLRSSNNGTGRVIVGAPRANSSFAGHQDIFQPGAIFSCSIDDAKCDQYLLDPEGNDQHTVSTNFHFKHRKDDGWLGATLDGADHVNKMLVACAPRWINSAYSSAYLQSGLCYLLHDASRINNTAQLLIPLQDASKAYLQVNNASKSKWYYGLGQAGMALHYMKSPSNILIGAPSVLDWQGTIIRYTSPYNLANSKVFNIESKEEDFSYIGYSVSSGKFNNDSDDRWYVVGAPRSNDVTGGIYVYEYKNKLVEHFKASGKEMGEYFGASLAVADITGDKVDEIIVGAPMHIGGGVEDQGCIYQFISHGKGVFKRSKIMGPTEAGARFGTAIAYLGDINSDGYGDIAVGAPYSGPNGAGSIFIYFGSASSLDKDNYLRVFAEDIFPELKGFGISISRGLDVDHNGINDIAVGSYKNGHVVVLKTRAKIMVDTKFSADKQVFNMNTTTIIVNACLRYNGNNVADSLRFERVVNFTDGRISFYDDSNRWSERLKLEKDKENCISLKIRVQNNEPDRRDPLIVTMSYSIIETPATDCIEYPFEMKNLPKTISIGYQQGCKHDVCLPELSLSAEFDHKGPSLIVGRVPRLKVHLKVNNIGEPAFNCRLYVTVPPYINYYYIPDDPCEDLQVPLQENQQCFMFGKVLHRNNQRLITLYLQLDLTKVVYAMDLNVKLNVSSSGFETNTDDNVVELNLPLGREEDLYLSTVSQPDKLTNEKQSVQFVHTIEITNKGLSPLDHMEIIIQLPSKINKKNFINIEHFDVNLRSNKNSHALNVSEKCREVSSTYIEKETHTEELRDESVSRESATGFNVSCDTVDKNINVKCKIKTCTYTDRIYTGGHIIVNITMNANLALLDIFETDKNTFDIITKVEVTTNSGNAWDNTVRTIVHKGIQGANLTMWILIGIGVALILLFIIAGALYKKGFFKRKSYETIKHEDDYCIQATLTMKKEESD